MQVEVEDEINNGERQGRVFLTSQVSCSLAGIAFSGECEKVAKEVRDANSDGRAAHSLQLFGYDFYDLIVIKPKSGSDGNVRKVLLHREVDGLLARQVQLLRGD